MGRQRRQGRLGASGGAERAQSEDHHGDARLHVIDAGTKGASIFHAERHRLERAQRPHGIKVSEQQNRLAADRRRRIRL